MSHSHIHTHTCVGGHGHTHTLEHSHEHSHEHEHEHNHGLPDANKQKILCIRPQSGLSGDMLLCGLACLLNLDNAALNERVQSLRLPSLENCLSITDKSVNHIAGKNAEVSLPHEHAHRTLKDILAIIKASAMPEKAKELAEKTFALLAGAEAEVHGKKAEEVTFHEVGALDSIMDICIVCLLFAELDPDIFVCGALPLADGVIECRHGLIPSPAPAVLRLLEGVSVCAFQGKGETVTPTAIALLKSLGANFGTWPNMSIKKTVLVYGGKTFENAPNGSIFALGGSFCAS